MKLKIYIDVYGRVGICEKFPDTEENAGLNEMLDALVGEEFYGDTYTVTQGFYWGNFILELNCGIEDEQYMSLDTVEPYTELLDIEEVIEELSTVMKVGQYWKLTDMIGGTVLAKNKRKGRTAGFALSDRGSELCFATTLEELTDLAFSVFPDGEYITDKP